VVTDAELVAFMRVIAVGDGAAAQQMLGRVPELALAQLGQAGKRGASTEFFLEERLLQIYVGDSALHVAAASYDTQVARRLVAAGADIRARNRRGAEPLHSAVNGVPSRAGSGGHKQRSAVWDPRRQVAVIRYLISAGADPNARAAGGVTPLHRAVRNRCAAAVQALLDAGADPDLPNDSGSTALALAQQPTGRGGTGSPDAKAQQAEIMGMLAQT
jgi:ankyrin repeat protein